MLPCGAELAAGRLLAFSIAAFAEGREAKLELGGPRKVPLETAPADSSTAAAEH